MNQVCKLIATAVAVAVALGAAALPLRAQEGYPNKPIKFVVGFPAGGPTDVVARLIADKLRESLGQQVLVENRPGAAGNLAADAVAKSAADGYTLLYASSSIATSPGLYENLPFNVKRDLVPVTETVSVPMVLVVNAQVPGANLREFIQYAKANPGKLNFASSGNGTVTHLAAVVFGQRNGLQAQHVPYRGTAPALADLIAGNVQYTLGTINTALPFIRDGRLRALAVTGLSPAASLPGVPTLDESGMKGFEASAWQGVMAPAGTPPAIVNRLAGEIQRALNRPELKAQLDAQDAVIRESAPAKFGEYIGTEIARWTQVIKDTGTKPE